MIYGSVCSGIEAATVAWHPLGWRPAFFSEIDAFPRAVLAHHYPAVPLHGDFTTIEPGQYDAIDLLVGGTPCQSFSVAGLRGGLADDRGNLALEFLRLAQRLRPRWLVWENVPGVLSSNGGRDFGAILGGMVELGYGFAYRVLDAQFFGVPQRRRRVFVVGHLGDWRAAAAVLFERHSLSGNPPPRREAGEGTAKSLRARSNASHREGSDTYVAHCLNAHSGRIDGESETFIPVASTLNAYSGRHQVESTYLPVAHALRADGADASEDGTGRGTPLVPVAFGWQNSASQGDSVSEHVVPSLDKSKTPAVALMENQRAELRLSDQTDALSTGGGKPGQGYPAALHGMAVRRLTPRECERLQGFPDDYTLVPYRGKPAADGPRYKALGNSMAVPCMVWIGKRVAMVDALLKQQEAA